MTTRRTLAAALATGLLALVSLAGAPAYADEAPPPAGSVLLPGEEIEESSDADAPTPVTAGAWRGELGPYETREGTDWFEYTRVTDESTLLVSVVSPGARAGVQDAIELDVLDPAAESCTSTVASASRSDDDPTLLATELVVGVQEAALAPDEDGFECLNDNRLLIRLTRGLDGEEGDAPYSLRVVEESPLEPDAELEEMVELPEAQGPDVDSGREDLAGGPGLEDAPEAPGGRYRSSTTSDRTLVYRVPDVGWGQTLKTALSVAPADLGDAFYGPSASLQVLSPMGTPIGASPADEESLSSEESVQLTASAGPVRYLNRRSDVVDAPPYAPGDYYVLVTVEPPDEGPAVEVDYTLEVQVDGEATDAPAFVEEDAYLLAEGDEQPTITAVGAGGLLATVGSVVRYAGAGLLAVAGLVALVAGARTLRT